MQITAVTALLLFNMEIKVKIDENQNEKDEIIQKINDVLSVLEYERLEEVLKYVKRKKIKKIKALNNVLLFI